MMKVFIFTLLIAGSSYAECNCNLYKDQLAGLTETEKETLRKYSFVLALHQIKTGLPMTVVSDSVVGDCKNRIIVEKYFDNKIAGRAKFEIKQRNFYRAKRDIAVAACKAVNTTAPWVDGVSHEIYNVVDDRLFPYWNACVIESMKEKKIVDLRLFTELSFIRPDGKLLPELNRLIDDGDTDLFDIAVAFVLKKNMGEAVSLDVASKRLKLAKLTPHAQISRDEAIDAVMRLLKGHEKVNKAGAIKLEMNIFGV